MHGDGHANNDVALVYALLQRRLLGHSLPPVSHDVSRCVQTARRDAPMLPQASRAAMAPPASYLGRRRWSNGMQDWASVRAFHRVLQYVHPSFFPPLPLGRAIWPCADAVAPEGRGEGLYLLLRT